MVEKYLDRAARVAEHQQIQQLRVGALEKSQASNGQTTQALPPVHHGYDRHRAAGIVNQEYLRPPLRPDRVPTTGEPVVAEKWRGLPTRRGHLGPEWGEGCEIVSALDSANLETHRLLKSKSVRRFECSKILEKLKTFESSRVRRFAKEQERSKVRILESFNRHQIMPRPGTDRSNLRTFEPPNALSC